MEFNEKLQALRKEKGITQEELAKELYVSRTAVSKWELGRGYPNLQSLKDIAKFFNLTIDQLLSGSELLTAAEQEDKRKKNGYRSVLFGLLDLSLLLLLFLPFFAQDIDGKIYEVSLLYLTEVSLYLKVFYFVAVIGNIVYGAITLILQGYQGEFWLKIKHKTSLVLNAVLVLLFTVSLQPYAAVLTFVFLAVKALAFIKWK